MTGLNKIIDRISQDSVAKCDGLIFNAQIEARKIKESAVKHGEEYKKATVSAANEQANSIIETANSSAQHLEKNILLTAKTDIINETIKIASDRLKALSDKEYFAAVYALVKKYALKSNGKMLLSKKDLSRLPKDFEKKVNESLEKGVKIKVSDKPANIGDGFILDYGDVEINCTFDAMIDDVRDELKDMINKIIFD